jgi:hypothetical protein
MRMIVGMMIGDEQRWIEWREAGGDIGWSVVEKALGGY